MLSNGEKNVTLKRLFSYKENNVKRYNVRGYSTAKALVVKFEKIGCTDASKCLSYFIKCSQSLSEAVIWDIFEKASNDPSINSPIKYFIAACRNQMSMR